MLKFQAIMSLAATSLSLAIIYPVQAATVNVNSSGQVTSIRDLSISLLGQTKLVNINFQFDTFEFIFGNPNTPNPTPFFWGNQSDAALTITEINNAINAVIPIPLEISASSVQFPEEEPFVSPNYNIPISFDGTNINLVVGTYSLTQWVDGGNSPLAPGDFTMYARIREIDPPKVAEPSGLMGIMAIGSSLLLVGLTSSRTLKGQ